VLVVEDNSDSRIIMQAWLEHAGYRVLLADDGAEAVAAARGKRPAVILMDLDLPVMDGCAAASAIKADATTAAIPIIALTALALPEDEQRARRLGVNAYLAKPASLSRVLQEMERVLEHAEAIRPHRLSSKMPNAV
jgi:two-component system cell cycle response regulator DivK